MRVQFPALQQLHLRGAMPWTLLAPLLLWLAHQAAGFQLGPWFPVSANTNGLPLNKLPQIDDDHGCVLRESSAGLGRLWAQSCASSIA